jgi:hypothetical protein
VFSIVTIGDVQEMNTMKFSIVAVMFAVVFGIGGMVMSSSAQALPLVMLRWDAVALIAMFPVRMAGSSTTTATAAEFRKLQASPDIDRCQGFCSKGTGGSDRLIS